MPLRTHMKHNNNMNKNLPFLKLTTRLAIDQTLLKDTYFNKSSYSIYICSVESIKKMYKTLVHYFEI